MIKTVSRAFIGGLLTIAIGSGVAYAVNVPSGVYVSVGGGVGNLHVASGELESFEVVKSGSHKNQYSETVFNGTSTNSANKAGFLNYRAAIGYSSGYYPFRAEVAYINNYFDYSSDTLFGFDANPQIVDFKNKIKSSAFMFNAYMDVFTTSRIKPYAMIGVGYVQNKGTWTGSGELAYVENCGEGVFEEGVFEAPETFSGNEKKTNALAWQAGAGVRVMITDNILADLSVQHIDFGHISLNSHESCYVVRQDDQPCLVCTPSGIFIDTDDDPDYQVDTTYRFKSSKLTTDQVTLSISMFFGDQSQPPPSLIKD